MYLERINGPEDVKALPSSALQTLCDEIRTAIIERSAHVGGHMGPNLAVVELTVALHRVFSTPRDKIVFDVSHQTYAHKMLTGRAQAFLDPARYEDVSGFSNPGESEHDLFAMGHTSTSVSLACGLASARDLASERYDVVAVIGDGSLSGGLAFEGLDNAAALGSGIIVVVNDNEWSIAPNHGGIYRNLAELRATGGRAERNVFRSLGFDYRYLENGHDVAALEAALAELRGCEHPVVLHVHTEKGRGYAPALADPETWHHAAPFDVQTGLPAVPGASVDYARITGEFLVGHMEADQRLVAVSAATPYIMGFTPEMRERAGRRFVDVGIAEEHAVTYVTGLARAGAHPVLGVYATFLQRAYDELWHDLCLNAGLAPATILVFGASAYGTTDATHLGFFDIPMLGAMPGLTYLAPTCREEYLDMLSWALAYEDGPVAIRVPVADVTSRPDFERPEGGYARGWEVARRGCDVALLALGDLFPLGEKIADALAARGVRATLVNPRLATTADEDLLGRLAAGHRVIVTLEDGILEGGFGERVARALACDDVRVRCYGLPHAFVDRYQPDELLARCGMTVEGVVSDVLALLEA
ncbi:1-deoxy-D-xylulose-5-phosphate synthase [Thermophilibacter sp. ET337]|uniref:1-deoxy-D-xylulose-5-phosphate synthase n=1 Tax=Thermophilibacter sp. ET337 TaxID=2973084 RepID=UPI0021AC6435|nr:1-deoxy-D-xylulose-5-phosphate synthase [Thermophilibacter sp. ET337]MCR8908530.1 1-deoxy-D-xylulose-5-phosphate synthase [Thermophilibacter sp. ET337]